MPKLILLSGPSCVGKSPLYKSFQRLFPSQAGEIEKIVLFNNRAPRPGERDGFDYYFRSHKEIEEFRNNPDYLVIPVRNDLQALEIGAIQRILDSGRHAFYEGAPYVVSALLKQIIMQRIPATTIFVSPFCQEEIRFFQEPDRRIDLRSLTADVMRKKLLRRKQKQMGVLSAPDFEDVEIRCNAAFDEICQAPKYQHVIPNHDGEDSENWDVFPTPIGDALQSVMDFVSILNEAPRPRIEYWNSGLMNVTE